MRHAQRGVSLLLVGVMLILIIGSIIALVGSIGAFALVRQRDFVPSVAPQPPASPDLSLIHI